jgi:hypothetical protein
VTTDAVEPAPVVEVDMLIRRPAVGVLSVRRQDRRLAARRAT